MCCRIYAIYFRHSDELIKKLEQAGLGYHVAAEATTDTLGKWILFNIRMIKISRKNKACTSFKVTLRLIDTLFT